MGSRELGKPRRNFAGPNPKCRALERSLTIRKGCSSAGGRCADLRNSCGVRGQAWCLAGEATRASTAGVVVLRIGLSWQSATSPRSRPSVRTRLSASTGERLSILVRLARKYCARNVIGTPSTTADSSIRTAGGFRRVEPAEGFSPVGTTPTWLIGRAADCLSAS